MTKTDLHRLVDALPETSVDAAAAVLAKITDPVMAAHLLAPLDDEALSPEDQAELAEAHASIERGEGKEWQTLKSELDAAG